MSKKKQQPLDLDDLQESANWLTDTLGIEPVDVQAVARQVEATTQYCYLCGKLASRIPEPFICASCKRKTKKAGNVADLDKGVRRENTTCDCGNPTEEALCPECQDLLRKKEFAIGQQVRITRRETWQGDICTITRRSKRNPNMYWLQEHGWRRADEIEAVTQQVGEHDLDIFVGRPVAEQLDVLIDWFLDDLYQVASHVWAPDERKCGRAFLRTFFLSLFGEEDRAVKILLPEFLDVGQ